MESLHILLVEDNEGDILLTTEALEELSVDVELSTVRNGKDAIDFISRESEQSRANPINLVLLDINIPKKNGHEVLVYIKSIKDLDHVPVFMLTTSSFKKDIDTALNNAADGYLIKPLDTGKLTAMMRSFKKRVLVNARQDQKINT